MWFLRINIFFHVCNKWRPYWRLQGWGQELLLCCLAKRCKQLLNHLIYEEVLSFVQTLHQSCAVNFFKAARRGIDLQISFVVLRVYFILCPKERLIHICGEPLKH